jgi:peptidoglycan/LPS O-acetylase OafA/YrhL
MGWACELPGVLEASVNRFCWSHRETQNSAGMFLHVGSLLKVSTWGYGQMTQPRVQQIPALTGIRIIAALWVVVGHFSKEMYGLFPGARVAAGVIQGGYLGVEVFFILSGFIISHNYAERFRTFSTSVCGGFLQNRLARLYPVHLLTLAVVVVLVVGASLTGVALSSSGKYDGLSLLMNVVMLQGFPPAEAWNGPAWSISAEAGAYVAFPLLALALTRLRNWRVAVACAALALAITIGGLYAVSAVTDFSPTGYASIWIRIAGEFSAGCFLWKVWNMTGAKGLRYDYLAAGSVAGIMVVLSYTPVESVTNFLTLPLIALFVFSCAAASGLVKRVLSAGFMDYGGRISYSTYMAHFVVLMMGGKLLPWEDFADSHWMLRLSVVAGYFVGTFAAAGLMYHFVEEPGRRWIGSLGRPNRTAPATREQELSQKP